MRRVRKTSKASAVAAGLLLFGSAGEAWAAGPLGPQHGPITTSDYAVDLFQGPVLASSRITAMGGAYTAIAEGAEGIPFNAAASSVRPAYSTTYDDFDLNGSLTVARLPLIGDATVVGTDFYNTGHVGIDPNFIWAGGGATIQHGAWGLGANVSAQQYEVGGPPGATDVKALVVRLFRVDAVTSYGFFHEQLHIGGGLRGAVFDAVDATNSQALVFRTAGVGLQTGAEWVPRHLPLRAGATFRSPIVSATDDSSGRIQPVNGDRRIGEFYLPNRVDLPWELEWGLALQVGPRPLNIPWIDEDKLEGPEVDAARREVGGQRESRSRAARRLLKERYAAISREKLLLSFSVLLTGASRDAVGLESMLARVVDRSGERTSLTMRGGGEAEVWPNRLQVRLGSYMEPTRFRESAPRLHATAGFEVRLFSWTVFGLYPENTSFRLSTAVDRARDYFGYSFAVGVWH